MNHELRSPIKQTGVRHRNLDRDALLACRLIGLMRSTKESYFTQANLI